MPRKTTTSGEFTIEGDNKLTTISLPGQGHLTFALGNKDELSKMAGALLRMTQLPIPVGTDMEFGAYKVTYTPTGVTVKDSRSLLHLVPSLIHEFPEVVNVAIGMSENAQKSRPGLVQTHTDARHQDSLSGQYIENP